MSVPGMSGRLSGRVESDRTLSLGRTALAAVNAPDSLSKSGNGNRRISAAELRRIKESLTDRDLFLIDVLATVHLATGRQLSQLLWDEGPTSSRGARRRLAKLTQQRVVARLGRSIGGVRAGSAGFVYVLDVVGQSIIGSEGRRRRPRTPGMAFVAHAAAVADCYVVLRHLEAAGDLELVHFGAEPECWRSFARAGGALATLKPDAFVVARAGDYEDRWFLEIDQDTESPGRITQKARVYVTYWRTGPEEADYGVFPRVLWIVPTERRKAQVARALGQLSAESWQLFQVCLTSEFSEAMRRGAGGGSS